ncbi:MAG: hypothetical protein ACU836_15785 [Gammaproteobacteria bacterium]
MRFANALPSFLRHALDVLVVAEIRNHETAPASLTSKSRTGLYAGEFFPLTVVIVAGHTNNLSLLIIFIVVCGTLWIRHDLDRQMLPV